MYVNDIFNINWTIDDVNGNETTDTGRKKEMTNPTESICCPINTSANSIKRIFIHLCIFIMNSIYFSDNR